MSGDTDSDLDTPDPFERFQRPTPAIDEKLAATILTRYHRSKGVLDDNEQAQVTHFVVDEEFEAAGKALSDIFVLQITYQLPNEDDERVLNLVSKQLPQEAFARFYVKEGQFDVREIKFYTQIVPDMMEFLKDCPLDQPAEKQLPIPKCYYPIDENEIDEENAETILVLEDLKAHGYRSPNFSNGLSLREATLAIEAIAKVHALSLGMRIHQKKSLNETYPFLFQTDKAAEAYTRLVVNGVPQLREFCEDKPYMNSIIDDIIYLYVRAKKIMSALLSPREPIALLTHTDFWCNNLLFRSDERHCIILDWQMVTNSRPTNDLALIIISSLAPELRRAHKTELLNTYWKAFTSFSQKVNVDVEGTLGYTFSDLESDYKQSQLLAILLCIGSIELAIGNSKAEDRLIEALKDLHAEGMFSRSYLDSYPKE